MSRQPRRDAHDHLLRALLAVLEVSPEAVLLNEQTPWESATFSGARHQFVVALNRPENGSAATLESHDFALPGHLVADVRAILINPAPAPQLRIEALTIAGV